MSNIFVTFIKNLRIKPQKIYNMKKKIELEETKARELYKTAVPEFKAMLEDTFGKEFFCEKITDRVKTFEDACRVVGVEMCTIFNQCDTKDEIAYRKLKIIARALNQGWTPDWDNTNESKWYPWFRLGSGFGFSGTHSYYWLSCSNFGARLCFQTQELAKYAGTQFESIYKDFLN